MYVYIYIYVMDRFPSREYYSSRAPISCLSKPYGLPKAYPVQKKYEYIELSYPGTCGGPFAQEGWFKSDSVFASSYYDTQHIPGTTTTIYIGTRTLILLDGAATTAAVVV